MIKGRTDSERRIKNIGKSTLESIKQQVISGSGQAPIIVLDVERGVKRQYLIDGMRQAWNKDIKEIIVQWKGVWYSVDKDRLFSKWIYDKIK